MPDVAFKFPDIDNDGTTPRLDTILLERTVSDIQMLLSQDEEASSDTFIEVPPPAKLAPNTCNRDAPVLGWLKGKIEETDRESKTMMPEEERDTLILSLLAIVRLMYKFVKNGALDGMAKRARVLLENLHGIDILDL